MKKFEWTEDVKLADGRVILVQRMTEFRSVMDVGAGFQRGYLFDHAGISADLPAPVSRRVEWKGRGISPRVLEVLDDGQVYLVCAVQTAVGEEIWQVPNYEFFVAFVLTGNEWMRLPLANLPKRIVVPNLLVSVDYAFVVNPEKPPRHFDLKTKNEYNAKDALGRTQKEILILPQSRVTQP